MNEEEQNRYRRNFVSNLYTGSRWHERVAHMPTDQVTAIYLSVIRRKPPERPEDLKPEAEETQLHLF